MDTVKACHGETIFKMKTDMDLFGGEMYVTMGSAFENLPDDMIYVIRTFLDFPSEMALDSTSKTIRFVMRDTVQPRMKTLDIEKELDTRIVFPSNIDPKETFRNYADKISKHVVSFLNNQSITTFIPPGVLKMPRLRNITVQAPFIIQEHVNHGNIHLFDHGTIMFWRRMWQYLESGQLETLCIWEPTSFDIDEQTYSCTPLVADRIFRHLLEENEIHTVKNSSTRLKTLRIPSAAVKDTWSLYDFFPNAKIDFWETMDTVAVEKQAALNRLMTDVF